VKRAVWERCLAEPVREAGQVYGSALVLCVGILSVVFQLWQIDLSIPFGYLQEGDFFQISRFTKGIIEEGWYLSNPFLGAPYGATLYDFPGDNLVAVFMKLLSLGTADYARVMNLYTLLTYPLTVVTSVFVFRRFQISTVPTVVGSLLFAFLPYHFWRYGHPSLASYYLVPLLVMVALWVCLGRPFFSAVEENGRRTRHWRRGLASSAICLLMASQISYYPFFGAFILLTAGAFGSGQQCSIWPLVRGSAFAGLLLIGVIINLAPTIQYTAEHGRNLSVANRLPAEAEYHGLKIIHLLLPASAHRSTLLEALKNDYNQSAPLVDENHTASLGLVGSLGFLILIGWLLCGCPARTRPSLLSSLSILNLSALLLGTIGGFGAMFAYFISPQIRAYNRISVYIAFFSLFTVVWLCEQVATDWVKTRVQTSLFRAGMAGLLCLGVWDQSIPALVPDSAAAAPAYAADAAFVQRIEAVLPNNAMIFQLPYVPFPEHGPVHQMQDYAHFRPYLHAKTLRWSYGAMTGREPAARRHQMAERPVPEMIRLLHRTGFRGIYIDRNGYVDHGTALEAELLQVLQTTPVVSANGRMAFFPLAPVARQPHREG